MKKPPIAVAATGGKRDRQGTDHHHINPSLADPPQAPQRPGPSVLIVAPLAHRPGMYSASLDGRLLHDGSRHPLLDAARVLIAEGADPSTVLILQHIGSDIASLRASIGIAAKLDVMEAPHGLRFIRHRASAAEGTAKACRSAVRRAGAPAGTSPALEASR